MEQRNAELGTELLLDNRRLILGFVLLVALCGACFVIGFMEGKRQAIQAKVEAIAPDSLASASSEPPARPAAKLPGNVPEFTPASPQAVREQLDWYKSVQRSADTGNTAPKTEVAAPASGARTGAATPTPIKGAKPPAPVVPVPAATVNYSVQVGAFRQLDEAEAKAAALKAKGFESAIEPPKGANRYYLVKVGKYAARADALVMQRKLEKAGFSCFIKTN